MASQHKPKQTEVEILCPWCQAIIRDDHELEIHWQTCKRDPLRMLYKRAEKAATRMEVQNEHFREVLRSIIEGRMPCVKCRYLDRCKSALDIFNIGTEAKIDCLGASNGS